ncbi:MAG: hypothetical protein ABSG53_14090 [Thermoguttaceae bacterium]|jgi:hypothetical protein
MCELVQKGGTAATAPDEIATGAPAAEGSKSNVAPGPTVSAVPLRKAPAEVIFSVPASTFVPP